MVYARWTQSKSDVAEGHTARAIRLPPERVFAQRAKLCYFKAEKTQKRFIFLRRAGLMRLFLTRTASHSHQPTYAALEAADSFEDRSGDHAQP
jgi:hypothetical protein